MHMTNASIQRACVKLLAAAFFVGLFGCVSRHVEIEQVGVMQARKYWKTDSVPWFGSKKSLDKSEICPPSGMDCITAKSFFHTAGNGLLWVAVDEHIPHETAPAIYFFNTKTGARIPCPVCIEFIKSWTTDFASGWWLKDDRFVIFASKRQGNERGILVADVGSTVELSVVKINNHDWNRKTYGDTISPDGNGPAWFECGTVCTLHWLNDDYTEILSEPTVCASGDLEVYWENGRPKTGFRAGTSELETCRDAEGALRYPLQPRTF